MRNRYYLKPLTYLNDKFETVNMNSMEFLVKFYKAWHDIIAFCGVLALTFLIVPKIASASTVSVVKPNGGECLTVGQNYTIEYSWSGADIEHLALYYRTDGQQPAHLDSSRIKHPIIVPQQGTTWGWAPVSSHISETGRIWVEAHDSNHDSLNIWDASDAYFSVRDTCAVATPSGASGGVGITPPPGTAEVRIVNMTSSTSVIFYSTDRLSYSQIEYGTTSGQYYIKTTIDAELTPEHEITLSGLEASTTYYFRTITGQALNKVSYSSEYEFTTLPAPDVYPPQAVKSVFFLRGSNTALLSWLKPPDADFYDIVIVRRPDRFTVHPQDGENIFSTEENFFYNAGLTSDITYFYAIFSRDTNKNTSLPVVVMVAVDDGLLEEPPTPPLRVLKSTSTPGFKAGSLASWPTENSIKLSWKNPEDENFLGVQVVKNKISLPGHAFDGEVIFRGRENEFEDLDVSPGVRYLYGVFAFDWTNNFSPGAFIGDSVTAHREESKEESLLREQSEMNQAVLKTIEQKIIEIQIIIIKKLSSQIEVILRSRQNLR